MLNMHVHSICTKGTLHLRFNWSANEFSFFFPNNIMVVSTAAVASLAKFGASCEDLTPSILVLLERWAEMDGISVPSFLLCYLFLLPQVSP